MGDGKIPHLGCFIFLVCVVFLLLLFLSNFSICCSIISIGMVGSLRICASSLMTKLRVNGSHFLEPYRIVLYNTTTHYFCAQ